MSPPNNLSKFFRRSWMERRLFIEAYLLLGLFRLLILTLPFKRIIMMLDLLEGESEPVFHKDTLFLSAASWALQAAAVRTPWESACLGKALAGIVMLRLRGIPTTLYLGVAKDLSGFDSIAAHAWLRSGDFILSGAGGHERYSVISSYTSLSKALKSNNRHCNL